MHRTKSRICPGALRRFIRRLQVCFWLAPICGSTGCSPDEASSRTPKPPLERVPPWFAEVTEQRGLTFVHDACGGGAFFMPEIMGGGAALFDYDGDDDLDIYLTNGAYVTSDGSPKPDGPVNRLYRQGADGRFEDVTAASGLGDAGYGMGMAVGDIDNDGDLDVYVTNYGADRLYRNRGDGTFEDVTRASGIDVPGWSSSAAFFDYDADGHLDLYVCQYVKLDVDKPCFDGAGRRDYCSPQAFRPASDVLLHNNGDGTFSDVSEASGIRSTACAGLGVICDDLTGDGQIDIYVANDGHQNNLWVNQGDGQWVDEAVMLGVALNMHGRPEAGMGVLSADFDRDGELDLFLTHLREESNTLYRHVGVGLGFDDVSAAAGLATSSIPFTGFGTSAIDLELDGDQDIVVVNGRVQRAPALAGTALSEPWDVYAEHNHAYLNDGTGAFALGGDAFAALTAPIEVSRGLATGDIDRDGDLDLLVANVNGPARLYANVAPRQGRWLVVRAIDPRMKRDAVGAQVWLRGCGRVWRRTIHFGFSYLSSNEPVAHFGLGDCDEIHRVEVRWPDGLREQFELDGVDQRVELRRGEGEPIP